MKIAVNIRWEDGFAMYEKEDAITSFYLIETPGEWVKVIRRSRYNNAFVPPEIWLNKNAIRRIEIVE